jgi:hypothetical protein
MSLEDNYQAFETFIKTLNLSEKEVLLFLSNFLLKNMDKYEELDKVYGINEKPVLDTYSNYYLINQAREYHYDSLPIELAKIAHNLLYVFNRIQVMDETLYGRK